MSYYTGNLMATELILRLVQYWSMVSIDPMLRFAKYW